MGTDLFNVLIGATALSLLHALLPNHWLPLVAVGRAERWTLTQTLGLTLAAGMAHVISTTALGILIGLGGLHISESSEGLARWIGSGLLLALGLLYFLRPTPVHAHHDPELPAGRRVSWPVLISLLASMFFSPCLEIEAFYLTAGMGGHLAIAAVAATHLVVTLSAMLLLVALSWQGLSHPAFAFASRYDRALTGATMILLSILTFFIHP